MRIVGLTLILVTAVLGTGGCAPSEQGTGGIDAKKRENAGYAAVENAERIYARGKGGRDQARREYRQKLMDRHRKKYRRSLWDSSKPETDAERWWRELWEGSGPETPTKE